MTTSQNAKATVADHLAATVELDGAGVLRTTPDGLPVDVLELAHDELGDPLTVVLRVETGDRPDDWITVTVDLSEHADTDPDAQFRDALAAYDRTTAAALEDAAHEFLAAMAGDWVHEVGVGVRALGDPECEHDVEDGSRGFEIVAYLCGDEVDDELWPCPSGDTTGRPLTAEHAAERAAAMLQLDQRVLDAWADQAREQTGETESDLDLFEDTTWDGDPIIWVSAAGDDGESTEDWPSIGVRCTLHDDGHDITACVWMGSWPRTEFDAEDMTPRAALQEALERLLDRDLTVPKVGGDDLARWSREAVVQDE